MKFIDLLIYSLILFISCTYGQKADSLKSLLSDVPKDTSYVNLLNEISKSYSPAKPDSMLIFAEMALSEAQKMNYLKGKAYAYTNFGNAYYFKFEFDTALEKLNEAIKHFEILGMYNEIANNFNRIGIIYNRQGNYQEGYKFSQKALDVFQKLEDLDGQWRSFTNLGIIAKELGDYGKAIEYYLKAKSVVEKTEDLSGRSLILNNIGNIYFDVSDYQRAMDIYFEGLKIDSMLNNKSGMGSKFNNIASCYNSLGDYKSAIKFFEKSLEIKKEFNDYIGTALTLNNIAYIYIDLKDYSKAEKSFTEALNNQYISPISETNSYNGLATLNYNLKNYNKAVEYGLKSYSLANKINNNLQIRISSETLFKIYDAMGDYKNALEYLKINKNISDTIFAYDKTIEIARIEARYEFSKLEEQLRLEQLQKDLESEKKLTEQKLYTYLLIIGLLLTGGIAFFFYFSKQQKQKANDLLQKKNEEINNQRIEIQIQAEQLKELNELKTKLFSIIAHDLRSPLSTIQQIFDAIKEGYTNVEEIKNLLPELSVNVDYTSNLVDNLLFWAKSQMEGVNFNNENLEVFPIVDKLESLFNKITTDKKILLKNNIDENLIVYADKNILNLVLRNLISNAVKYSNSGSKVEVNAVDGNEFVTFSVKDEGRGLTKEQIEKLFLKINNSSPGTSGEKGTGLGLILCKDFIEKAGGKIWVESEPDKGSTFYFTVKK